MKKYLLIISFVTGLYAMQFPPLTVYVDREQPLTETQSSAEFEARRQGQIAEARQYYHTLFQQANASLNTWMSFEANASGLANLSSVGQFESSADQLLLLNQIGTGCSLGKEWDLRFQEALLDLHDLAHSQDGAFKGISESQKEDVLHVLDKYLRPGFSSMDEYLGFLRKKVKEGSTEFKPLLDYYEKGFFQSRDHVFKAVKYFFKDFRNLTESQIISRREAQLRAQKSNSYNAIAEGVAQDLSKGDLPAAEKRIENFRTGIAYRDKMSSKEIRAYNDRIARVKLLERMIDSARSRMVTSSSADHQKTLAGEPLVQKQIETGQAPDMPDSQVDLVKTNKESQLDRQVHQAVEQFKHSALHEMESYNTKDSDKIRDQKLEERLIKAIEVYKENVQGIENEEVQKEIFCALLQEAYEEYYATYKTFPRMVFDRVCSNIRHYPPFVVNHVKNLGVAIGHFASLGGGDDSFGAQLLGVGEQDILTKGYSDSLQKFSDWYSSLNSHERKEFWAHFTGDAISALPIDYALASGVSAGLGRMGIVVFPRHGGMAGLIRIGTSEACRDLARSPYMRAYLGYALRMRQFNPDLVANVPGVGGQVYSRGSGVVALGPEGTAVELPRSTSSIDRIVEKFGASSKATGAQTAPSNVAKELGAKASSSTFKGVIVTPLNLPPMCKAALDAAGKLEMPCLKELPKLWFEKKWKDLTDVQELKEPLTKLQEEFKHKIHSTGQCEFGVVSERGAHYLVPSNLIPYISTDLVQAENLSKAFDGTMVTPKECGAQVPIYFDYEHGNPLIRIDCKKNEIIGLAGDHVDIGGRVTSSGLLRIKDYIEDSNGCYSYQWTYGTKEMWRNGKQAWKPSGKFPRHWNHDMIYRKVCESLQDSELKVRQGRGANRFVVQGKTSGNIVIETVIEMQGKIAKAVTYYPVK